MAVQPRRRINGQTWKIILALKIKGYKKQQREIRLPFVFSNRNGVVLTHPKVNSNFPYNFLAATKN